MQSCIANGWIHIYAQEEQKGGVDDDGWLTGSQESEKKGERNGSIDRNMHNTYSHTYILLLQRLLCVKGGYCCSFCIIVKGGGKKRDD